MKIAMLIHPITILNPQRCGGVERIALSELEQLRKNGIDAKLHVRKYTGTHPYIEEIKDFRYGEDLGRKYYARFIERSKGADILHGLNAPLLSIVSDSPKVLVHMHNTVTLPYYEVANRKYKECFFAFCSFFLLDAFLKRHPDFPPEKCSVLYNGVDTDQFIPSYHHEKRGLPRVLYAGSWNKPKGIFVFLEALRLLEIRRQDFDAVIAGSAYLYDTGRSLEWQVDAETKVKEKARKLNSVKIIDNIEYEQMPQLYQSSDILVFPSIWEEPFGLCAVEAMSCATPVIASSVGGIPEIVEDQKTGLLVRPANPRALADAVERLLDSENERRKLGREGRRRVEKLFSLGKHVTDLIRVYERMGNSN